MNIFLLHRNPDVNAKYHVDSHVVKMPLETAQILCTVLHIWGCNTGIPYKPTHKNHPCVKWAAKTDSNFLRLVRIGLALCDEYQHRFGKVHKCRNVIVWCYVESLIPHEYAGNLTPMPQAMPDEYKHRNTVTAYRNYYRYGKKHLHKWTKRTKPKFISK